MKVLFTALVLLFACSAMAAEGENILSIEPVYVYDRGNSGVGASLTYMRGITDMVRIGGGVNWNHVFGGNNDMSLRFNTDLLIDAFEWVPFLRFSVGMDFPTEMATVQPVLAVGAGLDWRPWPDYSIGVLTELIITGSRLNILKNLTGFAFCFYF